MSCVLFYNLLPTRVEIERIRKARSGRIQTYLNLYGYRQKKESWQKKVLNSAMFQPLECGDRPIKLGMCYLFPSPHNLIGHMSLVCNVLFIWWLSQENNQWSWTVHGSGTQISEISFYGAKIIWPISFCWSKL